MTLLNPEDNESQESESTFDWDSLLTDIQKDLGPSPVLPAEGSPKDNSPNPEHETSNGQCLYCVQCKDIKLWFPAFPPNPYHLPVIMWLRTIVAPIMQRHQRCFVCVLIHILNAPNFTIVDQIIAEKLMHTLPDLLGMPKSCIHSDTVDGPPQDVVPEEQPVQEETPPAAPRDIRQILADFRQNQEEAD